MKEQFEKIVKFSPAYDKRHADPKKNYGISAMSIWFILKGPKGAVQVMLHTDWYLIKTVEEYKRVGNDGKTPPHDLREKIPFLECWDVGYHSPRPKYKGQLKGKCELFKSGHCYYGGSSLRGKDEKVAEQFLEKGDEFIWEYLEKEYEINFGGKR